MSLRCSESQGDRKVLKDMIREPDKRIVPKLWEKELGGLKEEYKKQQKPSSIAIINLAKIEVLNYNRRDLERMLENERHQRERGSVRSHER